jgi:hypothetical protein
VRGVADIGESVDLVYGALLEFGDFFEFLGFYDFDGDWLASHHVEALPYFPIDTLADQLLQGVVLDDFAHTGLFEFIEILN